MSAWATNLDWLPGAIRAAMRGTKLLAEYDAALMLAEAHDAAALAGVDDAAPERYRQRLAAKLDEALAWWESEGRRCA